MASGLVERHPLKEKRRANKPLLERKRRAKINDSLRDLKYLVLASLNKDVSKFAKMEKVDILDMTVQFLKGQRVDQRNDDCASVYRAGYSECANDVIRFVMGVDGVDSCVKTKILVHLAQSCQALDRSSPPPSPTPSLASVGTTSNNSPVPSNNSPVPSNNSPVPSPTTSPLKPVSTFFSSAATPALETIRHVVMTVPDSPRDLAAACVSQSDAYLRGHRRKSAAGRGRLQRASDAPMASVKPTVRQPPTWSSAFDLSICKKERGNVFKPAVWRPW